MPLIVRPYTVADFDQLLRIQVECFPPPYPQEQLWCSGQIASHEWYFPEGALAAELDGEVVGSATCPHRRFDPAHLHHT